MEFTDLHVHFIPDLDDGSASFAETLEMLRLAHRGGTRALVATPHMFAPEYGNEDLRGISDAFTRTVRVLQELGRHPAHAFLGELSLFLGAEHFVSAEFAHALDKGWVLPLNGGRYLLVEFSPLFACEQMASALARVREAGWVPLIAHPERHPALQRRPARLLDLVEEGCLAQVNADSLVGAQGRRLRRTALGLLELGAAHVVSSDGHGVLSRTPFLKGAFEVLRSRHGPELARWWLAEAPRRIVANEELGGTLAARGAG